MELQEIKISCSGRAAEIELIPVGDIHLGTLSCDIKELHRVVDYIASNKHTYWIGMGDYAENIRHQDSRRFDPRNIPPRHLMRLGDICQSQKEELIEIMEPILTPKKCWGLHRGNHEEDNLLLYGEDLVKQLCYQFNLNDIGYQALTRVVFSRSGGDKRKYIIHSQHGHGGGRKPGSKINLLKELPGNMEADVYIMGHVHDRIIDDGIILGLSRNGLKLVANEKVFGVTGTFYRTYQKGTTSYAEKRNYNPSPIGCIKVTFAPWSKRHKLHIEKLRV